MADDIARPPPLLRLPRELQMHILTYLFRQDAKITIGVKERMSKKRLKLEREAILLHDPDWKLPKKKVYFPAVLLAHSELYLAGTMTFWQGNTFVFGECEKLRSFLSFARPEVVANITAIELGEGYRCTEVPDSLHWNKEEKALVPQ